MSVTARYEAKLLADETPSLGLDLADNTPIQHKTSYGASSGELTASTSPDATQVWSDRRALVAGVDTLDLTALPRGNLPNLDLTGLKVRLVKVACASANSAAIKFKFGATNPYPIGGSATGEFDVYPNGVEERYNHNGAPAVSATVKNVAVSGTGTDAYEIIMIAGT